MIDDLRRHSGGVLVLIVALVVGLLAADGSSLRDSVTQPPLQHPLVTDGSGYLNNGYADGARLLELPGNLVAFSADGTVAATRAADGQVTGYRLSDGEVVWQVAGDRIAALHCPYFEREPDSAWFPYNSNAGVVQCRREGDSAPFAALNLRTGRVIDFGFLSERPELQFSGMDDLFIYVTAINPDTGQTSFVRLDFDGREVSSLTLFGPSTDRRRTSCRLVEGTLQCFRDGQIWVFDELTGALAQNFAVPGEDVVLTADGYRVNRPGGTDLFYNRAGEWVGSSERSFCLRPWRGVEFSNADYVRLNSACIFSLVGPSGRVFAESSKGTSYGLLPQAGTRVPLDTRSFNDGFISSDERVIAISGTRFGPNRGGVRLFDPHTGDLIASFPLQWADAQSGILFWTSSKWEDPREGWTQVLVPGR